MLKIKNIGCFIKNKEIIKDISVNALKGQISMIIGPNGSGKSTLFKIIAGEINPSKGKILLEEKDFLKLSISKKAPYIGRVFQDPMIGSFANMTIWENFILTYNKSNKKGLTYAYKKEDFFKETILKYLGYNIDLSKKMNSLSGGQRQLLNLIMTTLIHHPILLLDEHTASLDPKTSEFAMELTFDLVKSQKLICLMISHNKKYIDKYANQIIELTRHD